MNQSTEPDTSGLTYAEALEAASIARGNSLVIDMAISIQPDLLADPIAQKKLIAISETMNIIGWLPGDFPPSKFDCPIPYRRLSPQSLDYAEKWGIRVRSEHAPLAGRNYAFIFGTKDTLPVSEESAGRFFSRLSDCLLTETQLLIARQYYHGLGFFKPNVPAPGLTFSQLSEMFPDFAIQEHHRIDLDDLHAMIFVQYCAVFIRAQWDKLIRLICFVLDLNLNWSSISDGLRLLEEELSQGKLTPWYQQRFQIPVEIAKERLAEDAWLKSFRDHLLHDVGQHSVGVLPHRKSLETASEMWIKVCDEHNWIREALVAALIACIGDKAHREIQRQGIS